MVWKLRKPSDLHIISGTVVNTNPFVQAPAAWPDANAASILIQKSKMIYPRARILHNFGCNLDDLPSDLISVGGPIHNEATRELLLRTGKFVSFEKAGDVESGPYYSLVVQGDCYTPIYEDGKLSCDFGAIVRMRNPLNSHTNDAILVVGCETVGVLAGALILAGDEIARNAQKELQGQVWPLIGVRDYVAVFSCQPLKGWASGWASDFILLILLYSGSCRDILPYRCQTKIVKP